MNNQLKVFAETPRLILREVVLDDAEGMLELDSDPEVHLYLPDRVIETVEEAKQSILDIRKQYKQFGIGRWSMIEKESGDFIGWAGLKWNVGPENNRMHFHDVGYRLIKKYWGKGYATEAAIASVKYAFNDMAIRELIGVADSRNIASVRVLQKAGMKYIETFYEDDIPLYWYSLKKDDF